MKSNSSSYLHYSAAAAGHTLTAAGWICMGVSLVVLQHARIFDMSQQYMQPCLAVLAASVVLCASGIYLIYRSGRNDNTTPDDNTRNFVEA